MGEHDSPGSWPDRQSSAPSRWMPHRRAWCGFPDRWRWSPPCCSAKLPHRSRWCPSRCRWPEFYPFFQVTNPKCVMLQLLVLILNWKKRDCCTYLYGAATNKILVSYIFRTPKNRKVCECVCVCVCSRSVCHWHFTWGSLRFWNCLDMIDDVLFWIYKNKNERVALDFPGQGGSTLSFIP